jgi:hypothetical protein
MPARNRASRPYSTAHRKARARLLPYALNSWCPCGMAGCTHRCDGLMTDPTRMDCDHTTPLVLGGGEVGDRIICLPCNRSAGAALGNRLRGNRASRDW